MFADSAKIFIKSGKGGDAHVSFRRELFVAAGGPDGGDGGRGGDIIFEVDKGLNTLGEFRQKRKYVAECGEDGGKRLCHGKDGKDLIIKVPEGTIIKDDTSGKIIADMSGDRMREVILKGGRGGKGNKNYATATMQVPKYAQPGQQAKELWVRLELKVIADVGLVGFPNVGKSTLLSMVSNAKPKIANYHFTTLAPNLGVLKYYDESVVIADIPGLIEGASEGAGLGHDFLRHVERVRLLVHVVDISGSEGRDPYEDYVKINGELDNYSLKLSGLKQIVCVNKTDLLSEDDAKKAVSDFEKKAGVKVIAVSAYTHKGIDELLKAVIEELKTADKPEDIYVEENFEFESRDNTSYEIEREDDGTFAVYGGLIDMLAKNVIISDADSFRYFQKVLLDKGIIDALRQKGACDGDTVVVGDIEFEFLE